MQTVSGFKPVDVVRRGVLEGKGKHWGVILRLVMPRLVYSGMVPQQRVKMWGKTHEDGTDDLER